MTEDDKAITTIKLFLLSKHFDAERAVEGRHDGHWMLATIERLCRACCVDTYHAGIENCLQLLETGSHHDGEPLIEGTSDWRPEYSGIVRAQAGLPTK